MRDRRGRGGASVARSGPAFDSRPRQSQAVHQDRRPGVVPKLDQGFVRGEFGSGGDGHLPGVLRGERCVSFYFRMGN